MAYKDKKEQIMSAAERLFTTRRFHEIKMDDIARAAGVGKGTIYLYFKDKDDLFFQTEIWAVSQLCELIRQNVPKDVSFTQQLVGLCVQIGDFFRKRRQWFRMMHFGGKKGEKADSLKEFKQRFCENRKKLDSAVGEVIHKGMIEKKIRTDIPPEVLARFLLGMLRTRAHDLGEVPEAMRKYEVVADLFLNGAKQQGKRLTLHGDK